MDPQSREGPGGTADVSAEPHAWPHEIFDLLALAAAFFAAVAVQPLLAFRASDYAAADADSFATTPSSGPTAISAGVALWSSLCSVLTTLSLIAAVLGRSLSTVEERMVSARRALLHRLMQPFVVLATVPLAISVIVFPNALYYSGFAMFPDAVTYNPRWIWTGLIFAIFAASTMVYAAGIGIYFRFFNKWGGAVVLRSSDVETPLARMNPATEPVLRAHGAS